LNGRELSPEALNQRRRLAAKLRDQGMTLARVSSETGLSVPTVISAFKAYQAGGLDAVDVKPRGRPAGDGRLLGAELETRILATLRESPPEAAGPTVALWQHEALRDWIEESYGIDLTERTVARYASRWGFAAPDLNDEARKARGHLIRAWLDDVYPEIQAQAHKEGARIFWGGETPLEGTDTKSLLFAHSPRGRLRWLVCNRAADAAGIIDFLSRLHRSAGSKIYLILRGVEPSRIPKLADWLQSHRTEVEVFHPPVDWSARARDMTTATPKTIKPLTSALPPTQTATKGAPALKRSTMTLTHLQRLEAESIHIMREVVAEAENPVMLYSIGKDSAVMLHLAMKAFYPAKPPFPLLHVDTRWKFREMYAFRDQMVKDLGLDLLVHINPEGVEKDINPFTHGSAIHTDIMKTEGLKQALDKYGFDAAFGGARRDEEKSRAKERIFSFRSAQHRWDPKAQRPELWKLYNARKHKGESMRVFPLSNWTELDIWQYIYLENIPIVPLYYSAERPVVKRDGTLIMVDDERMPLKAGEVPMMRRVRFRTLGCYPLTGAVESDADTLPAIIQEMLLTKTSERQGRVIDHDSAASMEKKKQEGYF